MSDTEGTSDGSDASIVTKATRVVVPNAIRRRFALKFVIVLLIMGVLIAGVGYLGTQAISAETEQRTEAEYLSLADQQENLVQQWVDGRIEVVSSVSENQVWESDNRTALNDQLQNRVLPTMSSHVFEIHVVNRSEATDDHVVSSVSRSNGAPIAGSRLEWVSDVEFPGDNEVAVTPVYRASVGQHVAGFASPVGESDRVFVLEAQLSTLAEDLRTDRVEGGFSMVVNDSGTIMVDEALDDRSPRSPRLLEQYEDAEALDRSQSLTDATSAVLTDQPARDGLLDESYAVGVAPVNVGPDQNWHVMVHAPRSELFSFAQNVSRTGLLVTGGLGVVIVLIGAVLGFNTSRSIDRLTGKAEEMEEGNLEVDISSGRIDNIGRLYDGFGEMRDALREQIREAEQARKEAEVSRAEAMEMNEYLQDKAEEYSEIMQACARGDLRKRMEQNGENESMDRIAEEFNEMITELEMTTGQLKTFAVEVEESGQSVQQSAETVRDASEQVADSVQKISDDAYDQKERLQNISEEMDEVASQLAAFDDRHDVDFGDALESIREIARMVEEAADLGEETMTESENVAGAAEEQAAELNEVSARAEELTRYAQYLGDGLGNFETEEEHEFVFQTGAGGPGADAEADAGTEESPDDVGDE